MQKESITPRLAAILIFAFFIRLLGIASRPVWYDEAFAILFAEKGLKAMLYGTLAPTGIGSADIHPLGYYTILWMWMKLFGESLIAVRLLSILAGLITICLVYLVALRLFNNANTAMTAMLFASLSPFLIHYAQEIRMYSFLAMWLMLATHAYLKAIHTRNWKWWVLFALAAALAQYTHHLAAFYLVSIALLPIFHRDWKSLYQLTVAGFGALILYSPWAIQLPAQFTKVQNSYWVSRPDISKLFTLILVYLTNTPLPSWLIAPALFVALIIMIVAVMQTIKTTRSSSDKTGLWLLYLAFAPPTLLFLFSLWQPVYIERALLPSGVIFSIWMAWVVTSTNLSKPIRYGLIGMLAACSMLGIYEHVAYKDVPYGPFKELGASLRQQSEPDDVIVHASKMSMLPTMLFDRTLPEKYIDDPARSGQDTLAPATQEVLGIKASPNMASATGDAERVWFVAFQHDLPALEKSQGPQSTLQYLNAHYTLHSTETWDGLQVFLYTKKQ